MKLTVIVPAFNEQAYLASTLDSIEAAAAYLRTRSNVDIDMIVVDNNSNNRTVAIARGKGATVVHEPVQGIARARDAGARHAEGDILVFIDADVIVPHTMLDAVHATMSDPSCVGGGVDVDYRPLRLSIRLYLRAWGFLGHITGMVQGATQFCRKSVFEKIGGYDEKAWIGEDVDFYWSLRRVRQGRASHGAVHTKPARAAFLPSLRQVAGVEDPDLDQPPLHRVVPPLEGGLEGLVLASRAVDPHARRGRRQAQPEAAKFRLKRTCRPSSRIPPSQLHPIAS